MLYQKSKISTTAATILMLAVISVTVVMQYRWNQTLDWNTVNVTMPQFRSADGQEMPPTYTKDELESMAWLLQDTVTENYKLANPSSFAITFKPRANYTLETRVMEIFGGSIEVEVQSYNPADESLVKEWKQEFASADEFKSAIDSLGQQIAGDLTQLRK